VNREAFQTLVRCFFFPSSFFFFFHLFVSDADTFSFRLASLSKRSSLSIIYEKSKKQTRTRSDAAVSDFAFEQPFCNYSYSQVSATTHSSPFKPLRSSVVERVGAIDYSPRKPHFSARLQALQPARSQTNQPTSEPITTHSVGDFPQRFFDDYSHLAQQIPLFYILFSFPLSPSFLL
jgi:hypothetical protein